jgi:biopolymer transport protein TolR
MAEVRRGKRKRPMSDINVVPYIDVMLVLLIIFMVTAPLLMQGVKVDLPKAPSAPIDDSKEEPLIVSVKANGEYFLKLGEKPEEAKALADIRKIVTSVMNNAPQTPVLIWGDTAVPYGVVVSLMTELQNAGAPSVGLVTEPPT